GRGKIARAMGADALSWAQCVRAYPARHREWLQADDARAQLSDAMRQFFTRFDVLLAPISPAAAFPHDQRPMRRRTLKCSDGHEIAYIEMLTWIALATVCGLPATAIPAGLNAQGLPKAFRSSARAVATCSPSPLRRLLTNSLVAFAPHLSNRKKNSVGPDLRFHSPCSPAPTR